MLGIMGASEKQLRREPSGSPFDELWWQISTLAGLSGQQCKVPQMSGANKRSRFPLLGSGSSSPSCHRALQSEGNPFLGPASFWLRGSHSWCSSQSDPPGSHFSSKGTNDIRSRATLWLCDLLFTHCSCDNSISNNVPFIGTRG